MLVGNKYRIESDNLNITLYSTRRTKGDDVIGYFSSIKNALKCLVDYEVSLTELKDLQTVVDKQDELYALIDGLSLPDKV